MTIKLHNTKTRKKEDFVPIDPENVRMYVCGPTVYDRAHLGNARPVVVFDVLNRLLRHVYGADHVTYVRNFTDVDDKINARAAESGRSIGEITKETTQWFLDDMGALGALEPDHMPRATQYIPQMVTMIKGLIADEFAYEKDGHVLFRVRKYADYGKLSGRSVDDMIAGARVEVAPYKEDPMDFVLWKPSTDDLPGWDSPWGRGRPGWHIECSAMAYELLGESFDIHGGGNDLMFPHHENEIAQSCCAHGDDTFARYWMHNEMLQVEGKKMSKSLGNFFTVRDLLDQGVPGEVIRFVFLSTHYRKPMDWTVEKASQSIKTLRLWRTMTQNQKLGEVSDKVRDALMDDLNTPKAIKELNFLASVGAWSDLKASARLLGLLTPQTSHWDWSDRSIGRAVENWHKVIKKIEKISEPARIPQEKLDTMVNAYQKMQKAAESIAAFTQTKEFHSIVNTLQNVQKVMEKIDFSALEQAANAAERWQNLIDENPRILETVDDDVQVSFDVFRKALDCDVVSLVDAQEQARARKDYGKADDIRSKATEAGFELVNRRDGTKWRPAT